jgi:hypothetical protein
MPRFNKEPYQTKSAVLFVIFNRPDTTQLVFEQIRIAKPHRLYIAADAPRQNVPGEILACKQAKAVVDMVDWECEVKTLFKEENEGCKMAVSSAVTWFFDHEEEGIILEDDCLPANSFFRFCDELLDKYRDDTRIRHITGCNFQQGKKWGNGSYYFSNRTHVWGWASWRRVWKDYDVELNRYNEKQIHEHLLNIYNDPLVAESWVNVYKGLKAGKINSWAYQLDFCNFFNNGLTIIPNENLISNIGFDARATHTFDQNNILANIPLREIDKITDPAFMLPQKQADLFVFDHDFNIAERRRKQSRLRKKVKRWFKSMIKNAAALMLLS